MVSYISPHISYQGEQLKSQQQYFWKVAIWDEVDKKSLWSEVATWRMAMFNSYDWKAKWIGDQPDSVQNSYSKMLKNHDLKNGELINKRPEVPASPLLRKRF